MLTQARDVSCTETETALEAALLEADEIKRLSPPFNIALAADGRAVWFATAELSRLREEPDPEARGRPARLAGLRRSARGPPCRARQPRGDAGPAIPARQGGRVEPAWAPGPTFFAAGLARFRARARPSRHHARRSPPWGTVVGASTGRGGDRAGRHGRAEGRDAPPAGVGRGARDAGPGGDGRPRRPRGAARTLAPPPQRVLARVGGSGAETRRLLVFQDGAVAARADLPPDTPLPVPPGHARTPAERRAAFDVATFDRLRVLTTELRGLAAGPGSVELRLGFPRAVVPAPTAGGAAVGVTGATCDAAAARAVRLRHPPRLRPALAAAGRASPPRPRLLRVLRSAPSNPRSVARRRRRPRRRPPLPQPGAGLARLPCAAASGACGRRGGARASLARKP